MKVGRKQKEPKESAEKENIRPNPFMLDDEKHLCADKSYLKGNRTEEPLYLSPARFTRRLPIAIAKHYIMTLGIIKKVHSFP